MKLSKLLYVLMLMVWLPACSDSEEPAQTSDTCVGADTLQVGDETVCVISSELLVETGFSCPASHPNGHSYADMVVCSQGEMLPPGFFGEMEQAYPENTPEGPCQQVTCAIGEVCMGGHAIRKRMRVPNRSSASAFRGRPPATSPRTW